jgi:hypothetical protein
MTCLCRTQSQYSLSLQGGMIEISMNNLVCHWPLIRQLSQSPRPTGKSLSGGDKCPGIRNYQTSIEPIVVGKSQLLSNWTRCLVLQSRNHVECWRVPLHQSESGHWKFCLWHPKTGKCPQKIVLSYMNHAAISPSQ